MVLAQRQKYRSIEQNRKPRDKSTRLWIPWGFPGGSEVKASTCNAGDLGSIPGSGRSPGEGNGNPLQYSGRWVIEDPAVMYVGECFAYVLL